jgi:pheromone shutdown protein TraB
LAILTAALASPITSLNPALAAGWFAGYVQLKMAEPSAEDLADFLKLERVGMFWSNKAGRVLMVTAMTNLGSMAGAWVAAAGLLGGFGL